MADQESGGSDAQPPLDQIPLGAFANPDRPDRRDFGLRVAATVFSALSAGFGGLSLRVSSDNNQLARESNEREAQERAEAAALAKQNKDTEQRAIIRDILFGADGAPQYYIPGTNNPYSGITGVTPHVGYALESILTKLGFSHHNVECIDCPQTPRLDGSVLMLGGPVPNVFSRQIMGIGRGSPVFSKASGKTVELPVSFRNILTSTPAVGARPQYELVVNGRSLRGADRSGSDYLVLTSIPNIFSHGYGVFNHRILIAAGLHGAGMRAVHLLLDRQPEVLNDIFQKSREYRRPEQGWQALIRVDNVDIRDGIAGKLAEWRVFPLKLNFDQARRAFEKKNYWIAPDDGLLRT